MLIIHFTVLFVTAFWRSIAFGPAFSIPLHTGSPPFCIMANYFLPNDAMNSADYAVARCLSVCPYITRRYSDATAKRILKLFSPF